MNMTFSSYEFCYENIWKNVFLAQYADDEMGRENY